MMGEYLMGAVSDLNIHCLTSVLGLRFPNSKNIFCPPHHQDDFPTVFQSWVGLDTILYAFKILGGPRDRDTSSGRHIEVLPPPSPHVAAFT